MREAAKGYLALAGSLTEVTRQRATAAARALVSQGEATAEQVSTLVEDLLAQSRQNREAVAALVTYEVDRTLGRIGLASEGEVAALVDRVRALEAQVQRLAASTGGPTSAGAADTTPSGREVPAQHAGGVHPRATTPEPAKAPATKGAVGKAPAKKAGAAKATAKKAAAAKATAKKAAAAKAPVPASPAAKTAAEATAARARTGTADVPARSDGP